jgi:hypothetical protein
MSTIQRFLEIGLRTRTPGLLIGPPGVGKSATIIDWGARNNLKTWVVIASLREPTDFAGLPVVGRDKFKDQNGNEFPIVHFAPPRFASEACSDGGLIFLDEITTAPPAVQAALLRAVLDLAFGDLQLDPTKVAICAAANPPELAAGGWDLAPPLANRFRHRSFTLDPQKWIEEFPNYWGSAPKLGYQKLELDDQYWAKARSMVAGFVRHRPSKLLDIPKEETRRGCAWPSPLTWDFASRQLGAILADNQPPTEALPYVADCVGEGAATEFMAWCREVDLPDPWELLKKPESFKVPNRSDILFAVLSSVATAAVNNLTVSNWNAAWKIFAAAANSGHKDVAASSIKQLVLAHKSNLPMPVKELTIFEPILKQLFKAGYITN